MICMLLTLILNCYFQIRLRCRDVDAESETIFWQMKQVLTENQEEAELVKKDFEEQCLVKAKILANIVQNRPEILDDQEQIRKTAELLQVDEFHIFNTEGEIYAGSEPKYFGYNFHSGEQMEFFLPMLEDYSLELCQPITPNTAEGKPMQYAAVWRSDKKGIVQVGMEPARVLEVTRKNELSYIFSLLMEERGMELFAADLDTYKILGATNEKDIGKTLLDIGIDADKITDREHGFHAVVNGAWSYCKFSEGDQFLVGRICNMETMYKELVRNTLLVLLYLFVISVIMIRSISRYLEQNIIQGIDAVNSRLQSITDGNLHEKVKVHTTEEFEELSGYINRMVSTLLATTDELSFVLDMAQTPIGIYEYSYGKKRVHITGKTAEILNLSEEEKTRLLANSKLFEERLTVLKNYSADEECTVFRLPGAMEKYIKIESYARENSVFGILMDVTKEFHERMQIEHERDEDALTGLYSRRAFYVHAERILDSLGEGEQAAFLMLDMDFLKEVNDSYGHEAGDCYLRGMAEVLCIVEAPGKVAARLSGDEFAVLLYGCKDREEIEETITKLREMQGSYKVYFQEELCLHICFSMGSAFYREDGEDYLTLMKCADERMYEEKRRNHRKREARGNQGK